VIEKIVEGVIALRERIVKEVNFGGERGCVDDGVGVSFNLLYDKGMGACELVELSPYGAGSMRGSCLAHWIKDWDVLYVKAPSEF